MHRQVLGNVVDKFVFYSFRDRLNDDDCIGTTFLSLASMSGQGEEGYMI